MILDDHARIGDAWRKRWDSLHLFTPGRYNNLPGMPFPGSPSSYPGKDEIADYLEAYARAFDLPVRTGVHVDRLSKAGNRFEVICGRTRSLPRTWSSRPAPRTPLGSRRSRASSTTASCSSIPRTTANHRRFRKGECWSWAPATPARRSQSSSHGTTGVASGPGHGQEPTGAAGSLIDRALTPVMWFMATRVLTVNRFIGRRCPRSLSHPPRGIPLGRVRRKDFAAAGIERVPRVTARRTDIPSSRMDGPAKCRASSGAPGFTPGYHWIDLSLPGSPRRSHHDRASSNRVPVSTSSGFSFSTR